MTRNRALHNSDQQKQTRFMHATKLAHELETRAKVSDLQSKRNVVKTGDGFKLASTSPFSTSLQGNTFWELDREMFLGSHLGQKSLETLCWRTLLENSLGTLSWNSLLEQSLGKLSWTTYWVKPLEELCWEIV